MHLLGNSGIYPRNKGLWDATDIIIFEHPGYHDAAVGVSEGPDGLQFRLNTPAPIDTLPWLRTPSQQARTNATNVAAIITKDYEGVGVLPVGMFRRQGQ